MTCDVNRKSVGGGLSACLLLVLWVTGCGDSASSATPRSLELSVTATPSAGVVPLTVNFTATAEGDGLSYAWDLDGDGLSENVEQNPTHTYNISGIYPVEVVVTNSGGETDEATIRIFVFPHEPSVVAAADVVLGVPPLEVQFNAEASGERPFTYSWDLTGDGTPDSTEQNPVFTYADSGIFMAQVTATDDAGETAEDSVRIEVNASPTADAGSPRCVRIGLEIVVDGSASVDSDDTQLEYTWSFLSVPMDSSVELTQVSDDPRASFTPDAVGDYILGLTVDDGISQSTAQVTITAADDVRVEAINASVREGLAYDTIDPPLDIRVSNVCADSPLYAAPVAGEIVSWAGTNATPVAHQTFTDADGVAIYAGGAHGDPGMGSVDAAAAGQTVVFDLEIDCDGDVDCEATTGGACIDGICEAPTCFDGLLNQNEASTDCGGRACGPTCSPGDGCFDDLDCASFVCNDDGLCQSICSDDGWTTPAVLDRNARFDNYAGFWHNDYSPVVATDGATTWVSVWYGNKEQDFDILVTRSTDNRRTWSQPTVISNDGIELEKKDAFPDVAADGRGGWIVIWESENSMIGETSIGVDADLLFATSSDDGESWTEAQILNTNASTDELAIADKSPAIATDGGGNWVSVWESGWDRHESYELDTYEVLFTFSDDGGDSWTAPSPVVAGGTLDDGIPDRSPAIAASGGSTLAVVWHDIQPSTANRISNSDANVLFATTTDPDTGWTAPEQLTEDVAGYRWNHQPDIATDGNDWLVVWASNNAASGLWYYDIVVSTGSFVGSTIEWEEATEIGYFQINIGDERDPSPTITTDSQGNWVAAWRDATTLIYSTSSDAGATWSTPAPLASSAFLVGAPSLAANDSGDWMSVWDTNGPLLGLLTDPETPEEVGQDWDIATSFVCEGRLSVSD